MRRLAFLLALISLPARASNWIRVASPSIEIFTDTSEGTARSVLKKFELLQRIFRDSSLAENPSPLRVFIFAWEGDFIKVRPTRAAAGFYQPDGDRDFVVLAERDSLRRTAAHEYLHRVIRYASSPLPAWIEEGVPEFYSTLSASATAIHVGASVEAHQHFLSAEKWMSTEDFALGSHADGPIFYAQSWALVHMLTLSPEWSAGMPQFLKLLAAGRPQQEAFPEAFGKSMEDAMAALHQYIKNPREAKLPAPPVEQKTEEVEPIQVSRLSPLDATLAIADLAQHTNHRSYARDLFLSAAKTNPKSPAAIAGLGTLALAEGRREDAQHQFEQAIALGSTDPNTYFQLAMLTDDTKLLEKTLAADRNFAEAHFLLGVRATDAGDFKSAIEHLRFLVAGHPRRFAYWNALAYAQAKAGDRQAAAESARRATLLASTAEEEKMAAGLTLLASENPSAHGKKPSVVTPPSWQNPKGDARAEGTLTNVDCDANPVRASLSTLGKTITLFLRNPKEIHLVNAGGASSNLTCGTQTTPVTVEYFAATSEVTQIEFRPVVIMKR